MGMGPTRMVAAEPVLSLFGSILTPAPTPSGLAPLYCSHRMGDKEKGLCSLPCLFLTSPPSAPEMESWRERAAAPWSLELLLAQPLMPQPEGGPMLGDCKGRPKQWQGKGCGSHAAEFWLAPPLREMGCQSGVAPVWVWLQDEPGGTSQVPG